MGDKDSPPAWLAPARLTTGYGVHEEYMKNALALAEKIGMKKAAEEYNVGKSTLYAWRLRLTLTPARQRRCALTNSQKGSMK